ncbi:MAG: hypothetical protein J7K40_09390 [candidate division Zixibacteria bacterium]|nr:hypothetical protein [candidate division Zixibacteria bacterium]
MANKDTPLGLVPIRHSNGAPYNGAFSEYYIPVGYGTALGVGDPVVITGESNTTAYKGNAPGTLPAISKAAVDSGYVTGVIVGFNVLPDDLTKTYNAASTERIAYVADDPDLVFEIQEDNAGTALTAAAVGLNADFIFTHSLSTTSGKSGVELNGSTAATTNTFLLKIRRLVNRVDNELGASAKWEVTINLHTQRYVTGY